MRNKHQSNTESGLWFHSVWLEFRIPHSELEELEQFRTDTKEFLECTVRCLVRRSIFLG
jgi:hypothetical protein